jgi:hypothetical protein
MSVKLGEPGYAEIKRLRAEIERLRAALSFARSVIKSGEPWTDECERRLALEGK